MNKIKFGFTNVHYAVITEDTVGEVTYGTPKRIYGAVSMSGKANIEKENIAADDISDYATMYDNKGYDIDIELLDTDDSFRTEVLGETEDENGVLIENKDAIPKKIALLFEMSGDSNKTRFVFYSCSVTKPDMETTTKGDKVDVKNDKISLSAGAARDTGNIKAKVKEGETAYSDWYTKVYVPTAE